MIKIKLIRLDASACFISSCSLQQGRYVKHTNDANTASFSDVIATEISGIVLYLGSAAIISTETQLSLGKGHIIGRVIGKFFSS
jgi:hypothetical protein